MTGWEGWGSSEGVKQHINVYGDDVEVDDRGYEVKNWERGMGSREGGKQHINVYRDDVEVDDRGYEVKDRESGYRGQGW